jgi:cysteine-rich repeat protein
MTFTRPQRTSSAAQNRARHSALTTRVTLAVLGLLIAASPAAAIVIGNPTTSPGGGWSCTAPAAGIEKQAGGGNYTCSGTAGAFTNLYLGINRNTSLPFGIQMDANAEPTGNEVFAWSANGATFIRYTGQTSIVNYGSVDTRVTLTFSNTGAVVSDATTQALTSANIRGAQGVHSLWRIGGAVSSLTVNVLIEASDAGSGAWQPADVYFGTGAAHRRGDGSAEVTRSHADLAFYASSCGDGTTDPGPGGSEQCDLAGANGAATSCCTSTCTFRAGGQTCRTSAGICDVVETCTGSSGSCPADGFVNSSTQCRGSAGVCDPAENCTGSAAACPGDAKSSAVCRAAAGVCDSAEICDGIGNNCPADTVLSSANTCRPSAGVCDLAENCTGSGVDCPSDAFESSSTVCRNSAGVCDVAENCTGSSAACPTDAFEPGSTECRASNGVCDVAESCTGSGAACPSDAFEPGSTICRGSAGACDPAEACTGSGADCPVDLLEPGSTVCRASAGVCDIAENCTGFAVDCPSDGFEPSSTECRASAGVCDVAESCTGSTADCPADAVEPASTTCRASAGGCDVAETCDGTGTDCPADAVEPASTTCRASAGACDIAETCDGTATDCPADAVEPATTECRASGGVCDVAESCDGSSAACPADAFEPASTTCRLSAGICDVAESCTGSGAACPADDFQPTITTCRPAAGDCDVAETCTGSDADCPTDALEPDGTSCNDLAICTIDDMCVAGVCVGDSNTCGDGVTQGSCNEECDDGNNTSNDGCSATCQSEFVCTPTPLVGCRTAESAKSQLALKDKTPDTKDQGQWKYSRGAITLKGDFGSPLVSTDYQLCIYANNAVVTRAFIPAGGTCAGKPCWKENAKGFQYKDKDATPEGVSQLKLKEGTVAGKSQIQVKLKGANIDMADLPLALPVKVQIKNSNGVCWETTHSAPVSKNDDVQYKDKND